MPVLQKLLAAQLPELTKSLKNFLQGKNVSGNFITKLPYYFQVCQRGTFSEAELL